MRSDFLRIGTTAVLMAGLIGILWLGRPQPVRPRVLPPREPAAPVEDAPGEDVEVAGELGARERRVRVSLEPEARPPGLAEEIEATRRVVASVLSRSLLHPASRQSLEPYRALPSPPGLEELAAPATRRLESSVPPTWPGPPGATGLAWLATRCLRPGPALDLLDRAIALEPAAMEPRLLRVQTLLGAGLGARALGELDESLAIDPSSVPALRLRAWLRAGRGNHAGAVADAERLLSIEPLDAFALSIRGEVRARQGDLEGAAADLVLACRLVPDDPDFRLALAQVERARGSLDGAGDQILTALAIDPRFAAVPSVLLERGRLLAARRDRAGALPLLLESARRARDESEALFRRGMDAIDAGRLSDSRRDLERSAALDRTADEALVAALALVPPWPGARGPR